MPIARGSFFFGVARARGALLLITVCNASRAHAGTPDEQASAELPRHVPPPTSVSEAHPIQPGRGMVRVHVSAGDRDFRVFLGRSEHPIATCSGECDFWAWPEKYRAVIRNGDGPDYDANVALNLREPGNYSFVEAHGDAQNAGLVLGASGPVVGIAGLIFTAAGLLKTCNAPRGQSCDTPLAVYIGLPLLASSVAMTTAGWWLYARNRAHFQRVGSPPPLLGPRLGILPLPRTGLGLGVMLSF